MPGTVVSILHKWSHSVLSVTPYKICAAVISPTYSWENEGTGSLSDLPTVIQSNISPWPRTHEVWVLGSTLKLYNARRWGGCLFCFSFLKTYVWGWSHVRAWGWADLTSSRCTGGQCGWWGTTRVWFLSLLSPLWPSLLSLLHQLHWFPLVPWQSIPPSPLWRAI